MKKIVFAFALNNESKFTKNYFGAADKFVIYEFSEGGLKHKEELANPFVNLSVEVSINEKREKIVFLLKAKNVSVLVKTLTRWLKF